MKVFLAEKPSAAKELAAALGANQSKDGYMEGNGCQVTWAFGHICQLAGPEAYGFKEWTAETLPIIPDRFQLEIASDKKAQFKIIKSLFENATEIINAADAGREGELIFRYIYSMTGVNKPTKRFWPADLTKKGIERALTNLLPGKDKDSLYLSGKGRSEADWLVGMNATRSATVGAKGKLYTLGRVQTPTLAIVCKRYLENTNFVPVPYFKLKIILSKDNIDFPAFYETKFDSKDAADKIKGSLDKTATCTDVKIKDAKESAPLLFDITELQKQASKEFKFNAAKTLEIAQDLYEKYKVLSYPRTGSRYITDDLFDEIPLLMKAVSGFSKYAGHVSNLLSKPISTKPVNNAKVTDHHALLPTEVDASKIDLPADHAKVFDLVVTRFLAAFSEDCLKSITNLRFSNAGHVFTASGTVITFPGWTAVEADVKEEQADEDSEQSLKMPMVNLNDVLPCKKDEVLSLMTKPKPILTPASLLSLMQTAGKELDDAELRKIMSTKENPGIGTGATRANIIETLIDREFIEEQKNKIIPTPKGLALFDVVKDLSIASPEITAKWERDLYLVESGELSYDQFLTGIKTFSKEIVETLLVSCEALMEEELPCPKCKTGMCKNTHKGMFCQNEACDLKIFKKVLNKVVPEPMFKDLLNGKESPLIKGFKSKKEGEDEKVFDAFLFLDSDFKLKFRFTSEVASESFSSISCPACKSKGSLKMSAKALSCSSNGCKFIIWNTIAGKSISEKIILKLVNGEKTGLIKGFKSTKTGKDFEACLKLKSDHTVEFIFENKK